MHEFFYRFIDVISDPINKKIKRSVNSGNVENGYVYMYNDVKILLNSYYGKFSDILILNDGVHEPQEEYAFYEILKKINKKNPIMLELGSYWAYYSLSFLKLFPNSSCFLIEPGEKEIEYGKKNFLLNGNIGNFIKDEIGKKGLSIDVFLENNQISNLDILHSDIQGFELEMLEGCKKSLEEKKIDYLFISTHSLELHNKCVDFLEKIDYHIVSSVNLDESYCCDGIIVAQNGSLEKININLGKKNYDNLISKNDLIDLFISKKIDYKD